MYTAVEIFATLMAIGFGIAGLINVIYGSIASNLKPVDFSLFLVALFVYMLATAAFKAESIKAREKLLEIWDGELI
jgi:tellurite resistance protein TehA-like permease